MPISKEEFLKKLNYIISLSNLSEENKKIFLEEYFSDNSDPVLDMARRFIAKACPDVQKLLALFSEVGILKSIFISPIPLLCLSPDITKIRVYPNIIIDTISYQPAETGIFLSNNNYNLKAFTKKYKEAKDTPHLQKLWGSLSQSWKRIKYYEDIPTSQVISKYLNKEKLQNYSDRRSILEEDRGVIIRRLVNKIHEIRKPLEITFAEAPEDFFDMYETGPTSCMTWKGLSQRSKLWEAMLSKKLCPTSFFSYCPITKGAYVKRKDKVICRTIIYTLEGKQFYGRIFSDSPELERQFVSALNNKNITALFNTIDSDLIPDFSIPGIMYKSGEYICPFPYFDNVSFRMRVKFKDGTFFFGKDGDTAAQRTGGYLYSKDYEGLLCHNCKQIIYKGEEIVAEDNISKTFCCWVCASSDGYEQIQNGRGDLKCGKLNGSEIKSDNGFYFTTLQAAKDCGYYPQLLSLGFVPEEQTIVTNNCWNVITLSLEGKRYGISEDLYRKYEIKDIFDGVIIIRNIIPINGIKTQKNLIFDSNQSIFTLKKSLSTVSPVAPADLPF